MRDAVKIVFVMALVFASHVSCLASAEAVSPTSHLSSPTSHLSSPTSHISSLISHISLLALTNHAGRVVSGAFGGVTNNCFIVNGKAYPLSVLPKSEILRVKKLAGCDVRTAKEKRLDHARAMRLERIRVREAEGEIDPATADRLRREASGGNRSVGGVSGIIEDKSKLEVEVEERWTPSSSALPKAESTQSAYPLSEAQICQPLFDFDFRLRLPPRTDRIRQELSKGSSVIWYNTRKRLRGGI